MIYLVHADGAFPNLALMRLSAYFKARGEAVKLVRGRGRELWDAPGPVYGSSIFRFSEAKRAAVEREWGTVRWGGTGVAVASSLNEIDASVDWESIRPDYSIYPAYRNSIGFTQRGCRLSCGFCVVPKKEGRPKSVASLHEIWRGEPHPRRVLLLDNDFFGQPAEEWRGRLHEAKEGGFRLSFCQGINIRQVDPEVARAIAEADYWDNEFSRRRLYTAWDNVKEETAFKRGLGMLTDAGVPAKHVMVYMLIGFAPGETWEAILYRFNEIVALGCLPYPMVYENKRADLKAFQRWACRGLYKKVPWENYLDPRLGNGSGKGRRIAARERRP